MVINSFIIAINIKV